MKAIVIKKMTAHGYLCEGDRLEVEVKNMELMRSKNDSQ